MMIYFRSPMQVHSINISYLSCFKYSLDTYKQFSNKMEKKDDEQMEIKEQNQNEEEHHSMDPQILTTYPPHPKQSIQQPLPFNPMKKDYSPIFWDHFYQDLTYMEDGTSVFTAGKQGILIFCIHGAGHSAQSFARFAKQVKQFATVVAYDIKGHGHSKVSQNLDDLSIQTLCKQSIAVLKYVMEKKAHQNVLIIGHSLGGSICARITDILTRQEKNPRIQACIVIDVIEGTAIQALPFMMKILNDRPKSFDSYETAIKWSITSSTLKRLKSARASIPPQLVEVEQNGLKKYKWKVNLKNSEKYWVGWFKGLTQIFLRLPVAKILVTAEKQRMDKQMTIAQMQGKFKLTILYNVGHSIQEDDYKGLATMIYDTLHDFRIPQDQSEVKEKQQKGIANFHPHLKPYIGMKHGYADDH